MTERTIIQRKRSLQTQLKDTGFPARVMAQLSQVSGLQHFSVTDVDKPESKLQDRNGLLWDLYLCKREQHQGTCGLKRQDSLNHVKTHN